MCARLALAFCASACVLATLGCAAPFPNDAGGQPTASGEVSIAVAANARFVFEELIPLFEQASGVTVKATYGASGVLYSQILNGAPFDLFYAADTVYPGRLAADRLAAAGSLRVYATGRLALWVRSDSPLDVGSLQMAALLDERVQKIAIANPQVAPYGQAAVAAMQHYQVYEQARGRIVYGENISQTLQFVQLGAADAGLVALSVARAPELQDEDNYWEVPEPAHPPIEQAVVVLAGARHATAAAAFEAFMQSATAAEVLQRYGYGVPEREGP